MELRNQCRSEAIQGIYGINISRITLIPFIALFFLFLFSATAYPIPKEIEEALKLNRINHYDEAIQLIEKALREEKIKPDITTAYTVGRILYRKGEFYHELSEINFITTQSYLEEIVRKEKPTPPELKLFLGISYFFMKQYVESAGILTQVAGKGILREPLAGYSSAYMAASYYMSGEKDRAFEIFNKLEKSTPLSASVTGYLYSYLGINPSKGEEIAKWAFEKIGEVGKKYRSILTLNYAYTLMKAGNYEEAYRIVKGVDLDVPLYIYKPLKFKEVRLYDLSMVDSYAKIIFGEAIKNLEPIALSSSGELASFASFYVAQMYLYLGEIDKSFRYAQKARRLSVASSLTMVRAIALENSLKIMTGKERKALKVLSAEIEKIFARPSTLLEMMYVVINSGVPYEKTKDLVAKVESFIYDTQWNRTRRDSALLGELALYSGRTIKAIYYLERARDKGNKNKIETNDPAFLLKLAYVYYLREYYSESLEILFALGKHFTGIRLLQNNFQSIYSYKQRGSGEAFIE